MRKLVILSAVAVAGLWALAACSPSQGETEQTTETGPGEAMEPGAAASPAGTDGAMADEPVDLAPDADARGTAATDNSVDGTVNTTPSHQGDDPTP